MNAETQRFYHDEPEQIEQALERGEPLIVLAEPTPQRPVAVLRTPDGMDVETFTLLLQKEVLKVSKRDGRPRHEVLKDPKAAKLIMRRALKAQRLALAREKKTPCPSA